MKKQPVEKKNMKDVIRKYLPYGVIAALILVSGFILLRSESGLVGSVQAQTNPQAIGDTIVDTVTGAAAEHNAEIAEAEREIETAGDEPEPVEEEMAPSLEDVLGETAVPEMQGAPEVEPVFVGPGSPYYTSSEGLGGLNIVEMTYDELYRALFLLNEIQAAPNQTGAVSQLLPVVTRFQHMVTPPREVVEGVGINEEEDIPWESGARRYSPFDPVGVDSGVPSGRATPLPPFSFDITGRDISTVDEGPECSASNVASSLTLKGVIGEVGNYRCILEGMGEEKELGVGEEVVYLCEKHYIVMEITLTMVVIADETDMSNRGVVQFGSREGISGISISY